MSRVTQNGGVRGKSRQYYDAGNMTGIHDMQAVYDSFSGSPTNREGYHQGNGTYTAPAWTDELYTLLSSSIQTGLTEQSGSGLSIGYNATYGHQQAGNASGFSCPLQRTATLDGSKDWLIQVTTRCYSSCWDPAIQLWPASSGRSAPSWGWSNSSSTHVSFQCNCKSYTMINTPTGGSNSGSIGGSNTGEYFTHHLWWLPTTNFLRGKITYGSNDASVSGSNAATATSYGFSTYNGTACYVGLASDYDGASIGSQSTNFTFWRIREFENGYNTNSNGLPTW